MIYQQYTYLPLLLDIGSAIVIIFSIAATCQNS
jgi:hypothetical protein